MQNIYNLFHNRLEWRLTLKQLLHKKQSKMYKVCFKFYIKHHIPFRVMSLLKKKS